VLFPPIDLIVKMGVVKVTKDKPYFKRYQVKYRRRREGKTDYQARRALVIQDKDKYNTPKYRFVVRFTNKDVVCQLVAAKIVGDQVVTSAYAHELPRYGVKGGLTNYAAAYATGLLLARRHLTKIGLADKYAGNLKVDGQDFNVEEVEGAARPFAALLDIGLKRTTTGARLFAALKGATDGGINIPHSETRFVGYNSEEKKLNTEVLRKHIFGVHVADYMNKLQGEDEARYKKQFSHFIKNGLTGDSIEKMYKAAHESIRKDPAAVKKPKKTYDKSAARDKGHTKKLTLAQRRGQIKQRKNQIKQARAKA